MTRSVMSTSVMSPSVMSPSVIVSEKEVLINLDSDDRVVEKSSFVVNCIRRDSGV
ncbi:unnamed protein product [Arctogadus glacialis]